jgi:hypothetical protein
VSRPYLSEAGRVVPELGEELTTRRRARSVHRGRAARPRRAAAGAGLPQAIGLGFGFFVWLVGAVAGLGLALVVLVRNVQEDQEMAWSSPVFVDFVAPAPA